MHTHSFMTMQGVHTHIHVYICIYMCAHVMHTHVHVSIRFCMSTTCMPVRVYSCKRILTRACTHTSTRLTCETHRTKVHGAQRQCSLVYIYIYIYIYIHKLPINRRAAATRIEDAYGKFLTLRVSSPAHPKTIARKTDGRREEEAHIVKQRVQQQ